MTFAARETTGISRQRSYWLRCFLGVHQRGDMKGHGFSRAVDAASMVEALAAEGWFLKPIREHATNNAQRYFVTSETWQRRALFRAEPWAKLFFKTLLSYRGSEYLVHPFLLMPDHSHLLMAEAVPLQSNIMTGGNR